MATDFEFTGDKELLRTLRKMPAKIEKRVLRASITAGIRVMRKAIKQATPVAETTPSHIGGTLKRATTHKVITKRGVVIGVAGHAWSKGGKHGHFSERGTDPRFHKSGKSVGLVRARNWMLFAMQATIPRLMPAINSKARQRIASEIAKA